MPFTPFHLGPALALGLPTRKYIHAPTFIIANVIIDIEPLMVILLDLNYPLHGYLHTFIGAITIGLALGYIMYLFDVVFKVVWKKLLLASGSNICLRQFLIAGISGTALHVLLDAPLYYDIKPFYPFTVNPIYYPEFNSTIYMICTVLGLIGLIYYIYIVLRKQV